MQLDHFIIFAENPNIDNLVLMITFQFWAVLAPLAAGPIYVLCMFMWDAVA